MTQVAVFLYALLTSFVASALTRNRRAERPSPQMMTMVGWSLFSLSATLALLMGGMAIAIGMGMQVPLVDPTAL